MVGVGWEGWMGREGGGIHEIMRPAPVRARINCVMRITNWIVCDAILVCQCKLIISRVGRRRVLVGR